MPHSAVLLAGGKSSRMGRDKALLDFRGQPLWRHQLDTLSQTAPQELFISAAANAPYGGGSWRIIPDAEAGHGPLAGIVSALKAMRTEWMLVLAVDVPFVTADFLRNLLVRTNETRMCVIPVHENGDLEPLVAVYPRTALARAETLLQAGERRLSTLISHLETDGMITKWAVDAGARAFFSNWNTPGDVESGD